MEIASEVIVASQKLRCYNGIMNMNSVQPMSDEQLLERVEQAAAHERGATVQLIALLAEMDARRLFLGQGYSSMFVYCTKRLHLSEHAAYGRIEAARAARKFPALLDRLGDGSITLTTVCLLSNHLTDENHKQLLEAAMQKTRREVEELVATLHPMPAEPSSVRRLWQPRVAVPLPPDSKTDAPAVLTETRKPNAWISGHRESPAAPIVRPIAPECYRVQFSIGPETHKKLRRLQDLLRHAVPNGDVGQIFDRAVTLLLREVERQKIAVVDRPQDRGGHNTTDRHVPAAVRRTVWARDNGQCAFRGPHGRCEERGFLEFHHMIPFADGGPTTVDNLQLRCRPHNGYEARKHFGEFPVEDAESNPSL